MVKIILTSAAGVVLLTAFSFFLVWMNDYSKKRARRKYNKKFMYFDKYISEMQTASERQMEKLRRERMESFAQSREIDIPEPDITRF